MKTRKIISTLLALCMLLSLFPTMAFAEDENEPEHADEQLVNDVMPDGEAQGSPDPSSGEPQNADTTQTEAEKNEDALSLELQSVSAAQMQTLSQNRSNGSVILTANNASEVSSGTCGAQGNNLTWTLYDNGELVISGTGDMADYGVAGSPWYEHRASITSVTIPAGVTSIGDGAFQECSALTSVTIPEGVTSVGDGAFYLCTALTSVTIPQGVTGIGDDAFAGCIALTGVTIPSSVTGIGYEAFFYCVALESVTFLGSVTSIGDWAFGLCAALKSMTIPAGVTSIGDNAFAGCQALTSIVIPASVTRIGAGAFAWSGIESITVAEGNVNFRVENSALIDRGTNALLAVAPAITGEYVIPDGVTSIGDGACQGCTALTSVTIPAGVTSIGDGAFYDCSALTSVTFPTSVTSIGKSAFEYCGKLTDVYYGGTEEQAAAAEIAEGNECLTNATIHFTEPPAEPLKIVINSASVVFDGLIRLKYYFTLPDVLLDASDSYLVFYKNDQELKRTALKNGKPVNQSGDPSNKSFDLSVVAKEFNDEIVIKLLDKDGGAYTLVTGGGTDYTESGFPYSVRKYADYLKDNSGKAKMRALAKALGEYGDAASVYFGGAGTVSDDVKAVTLDDFNDYAVKMDGVTPAGITGKSMSVMFEADNSLRIYLSFASGYSPEKYSFTVDGNPATMQENANHEFYLTAKNIAAKDLEAYHTFTISDGKDTYTIQASVLSYARILVSGNKPNSQNLGKALYLYNRAADAYFAN